MATIFEVEEHRLSAHKEPDHSLLAAHSNRTSASSSVGRHSKVAVVGEAEAPLATASAPAASEPSTSGTELGLAQTTPAESSPAGSPEQLGPSLPAPAPGQQPPLHGARSCSAASLDGGTAETPLLSTSSRGSTRSLWKSLPPAAQEDVGSKRRQARMDWNLLEVSYYYALVLEDVDNNAPIDETMAKRIVVQTLCDMTTSGLSLDAMNMEEFHWIMRFADHDQDGQMKLEGLYLGLQAAHGYHYMYSQHRQSLMKYCQEYKPQTGIEEQRRDLARLLKKLNGTGNEIEEGEVTNLMEEAAWLQRTAAMLQRTSRWPSPHPGKEELLRALGAWYTRVSRTDTGWRLLYMALDRWLPTPALPRKCKEDALRWHRLYLALQKVLLSIFFLVIFCFGGIHGDDRCPKDLDGLLVWYGMLGFAWLFSQGAREAKLEFIDCDMNPRTWLAQVPRLLGVAAVAGVKCSLLLLPWRGLGNTFALARTEWVTCGEMSYWFSFYLWTSLVVLELMFAGAVLRTAYNLRDCESGARERVSGGAARREGSGGLPDANA